jgi:apolipoprotein N-acyltransferase
LKIKLGNKELIIGIGILMILFFQILFGITGVRTITGVFLFFFLPFYLILDNFNLERNEKIVFSFFMGLGIFSTFVYYLGILVGSIRIAMVITFILLMVVAIMLKKFKKSSK